MTENNKEGNRCKDRTSLGVVAEKADECQRDKRR